MPNAGLRSRAYCFQSCPPLPIDVSARTIAGASDRACEATLGFNEFLGRVVEERMKKMITSPEMFERFPPYAMAFGVADNWAKAFEDSYPQPPTWHVGGSG